MHYPDWKRVESSEEDRKLLFRFDPVGLNVEIVTRRRLRGEWQSIRETMPLLPYFPGELAGSIQALIALHTSSVASVPFSHTNGTATL